MDKKNTFPPQEQKTLRILDEILKQKSIRAVVESIIPRVEHKLKKDSEALLAWEPVPLETFGNRLPAEIRSSWVFVVRAGSESGAERHPNSHQRMMSHRGSGDLQVFTGERWRSNRLISDSEEGIGRRWVSIPPQIWHQAVAFTEDWVVVSFHTVPEEELIEERPDPADARLIRKRLYLDKHNRDEP